MSGISGGITSLIGSDAAKAAGMQSAFVQLKGLELEQKMFAQQMAITKPMRTMEMLNQGILTYNMLKGPGEYNYQETPGLEGFLSEMNKEFDYKQSQGLQESIDAANRATERSGIAQGPGGATEAAVARGTAGMTYQDFLSQQGRFDMQQQNKALARAEDYWKDRTKNIEEWRATKIDPYMNMATPMSQSVPGSYAQAGQSMGNAFTNVAGTLGQSTMNASNALTSGINAASQNASNTMSLLLKSGVFA